MTSGISASTTATLASTPGKTATLLHSSGGASDCPVSLHPGILISPTLSPGTGCTTAFRPRYSWPSRKAIHAQDALPPLDTSEPSLDRSAPPHAEARTARPISDAIELVRTFL